MNQIQEAFDYAYRSLTTTMCKEKYDSQELSIRRWDDVFSFYEVALLHNFFSVNIVVICIDLAVSTLQTCEVDRQTILICEY